MNIGDFTRTEEVIYRNSISGVTIFKARHVITGLKAAWKEVNYPRSRSNRLNLEVSLHSKLTHPYITPILASTASTEQLILISPLAETDLNKEILKRKSHFAPWTEQELSVMLAMCVQALAHCQRLGLSHRDIKPANLFLTAQGVVQLGDFGSAREVGTMEGKMSLVGTPLYLSPALKSALTSLTQPTHNTYKSDVYSLGLTFLHMARLEYPEEGLKTRSLDHYVSNLNYGEWLKTVLRVMLTEDEAERVDFIGLQVWTQDEIKPIPSVFYRETSEVVCISCNSNADYICLCEFPVPVLCSSCSNSHSSAAHCLRPLSEAGKYSSTAAVQRYRDRTAIITKVKTGLQATIAGVKSGLEELDRRCEEVIREVKRIKEERSRKLLEVKDRAEEILAKARKELEEQRDEAGESWFSAWNAVELPYFAISIPSFASADCLLPPPLTTDHLDALSVLLQPPPFIPLLHKKQISLYFPQSHWRSFPLSSLCIDSCTSLALANAELVLAVGGETHPLQAATISSVTGEVERLGQCGIARKLAGVVVTLGHAFIFGGQNSEKSVEKLPLSGGKSVSLSSLPVAKHSFTPCLYSSHIYLPGPSIYIYNPAEDHYRLFTTCGLPMQYCSCIVQEDTLYCFTSLGTVWLDLRKSRPVVRTAAWGALQDWTLPVWAGNSVYFSGENKLRRLRMDTKEMTTLLQE